MVCDTATIIFFLCIILMAAMSVIRIVRIKLNNGRLRDMKLPIIGGIILPVILAGVFFTGIVLNRAMDRAKTVIRLTVCKKELQTLGTALHSYSNDFNGRYPDSNRWCDLLVRYTDVNEQSFGKFAADGRSSYAINPDAEPNSPPDTVLLFEADGLWNQSGGAERLTFEKGLSGRMVLFNDGQVRLIRQEDVNGLKWD